MTEPASKIFQIGFNKCGTTSIAGMLKAHGLRIADWEKGALARSIDAAVRSGGVPLADWPDAQGFTDMEYVGEDAIIEGCRHFAALDAAYPDARFILNTRNAEAWVQSRLTHREGRYAALHLKRPGAADLDALADLWRLDWHEHHLAVLQHFSGPARARLAIWNIDAPDFETIGAALGLRLDPRHWRHLNRSHRFWSGLARRAAGPAT